MNEKKIKLIHMISGIAISAALIVAAACLIISAYTIYNSGDAPYTPESIGEQYSRFALPLWIAVAAVGAGILLNLFLPDAKKSKKNQNNVFIRLAIMQKKLSAIDCGADILSEIEKERRYRKTLRIVIGVLCALSFIPVVIVLCDYPSYTVENLTPAILRTVLWLGVGSAISAVLLFVRSMIDSKSAEREMAKTKIALSDSEKKETEEISDSSERRLDLIRLILVGAACALIFLGSLDNGFNDVLQKAIRICTECIGLG